MSTQRGEPIVRTLFWLVLISLVVAGVVVSQEQANHESVREGDAALMLDTLLEETSDAPEDVRYSIVDEDDIPDYIRRVIEETKSETTSMVFDGEPGTQYVYIALGERRTGGYHISLEGVEQSGERILVSCSEIKPADSEMVTQVLTYPWIVLKVHSELPIEIAIHEAGPQAAM
jgi:hypothetical protein